MKNRAKESSVIVWEQHGVGDAGFRTEQSYQAFYRHDDANSPLFFVPIVAGTPISRAVADIFATHPYAAVVEITTTEGYVITYQRTWFK